MHVTLSAAQMARFTCVAVPAAQTVVPVLAKKTENVFVSPGFIVRNADSNWYSESYPATAAAGAAGATMSDVSASSAAAATVRIELTLAQRDGEAD